ncbi:MAG TPA: cytochrome c biogenesis protein CcsA [Gammaproteobacteria bacterium]|nr:cytochrome c biogenesis protein CcsA [Gammaproteobacteria bacterium]
MPQTPLNLLILFTALIGYLVAAAGLALCLRHSRQSQAQPGKLWLFVGIGLLASAAHLSLLWQTLFQAQGIALSLFPVISLTGWLIGLIALGIIAIDGLSRTANTETGQQGMLSLPVVILPLVAGSILPAALLPGSSFLEQPGWPLTLHILSSLLAYSLFAVAAMLAILLGIQDYRLRRHKSAAWFGLLPPLAELEILLFAFIGVGFVLLTLALFSGLIFVDNLMAQHLIHKTTLSVCAWLIFGLLLLGRWRKGWRGRRAIRWTLGGFIVLALAYFGSKAVLEIILNQHWG